MKHDFSYGIIPVRIWNQQRQVLLVQHYAGHWAFPKGHAEVGENHQQAAERELLEETGLTVQTYLSDQTFIEHYFFRHQGELIEKKVQY
ncbi:MAG: NUDIX domain-containing protein, partial [Chlamydiales bacterium]